LNAIKEYPASNTLPVKVQQIAPKDTPPVKAQQITPKEDQKPKRVEPAVTAPPPPPKADFTYNW
jgi:hypothetical protein